MIRKIAPYWFLVPVLLLSSCRSGGGRGGWDAYVTRLYQEVQVGLELTEQSTEASLQRAIQVFTASIAKADRLLGRAGTDAQTVQKLKEFKAVAYLSRGIAHWALAEAGVVAGGRPDALIRNTIADASTSINLAAEVPLTETLKEVRSSSYGIRGRGYVLDTLSKELANLGDCAPRILADGNGAILGLPQKWDGYALKGWAFLATGNPDGLRFANRAVELEPHLPAEVLTTTLATLVREYTNDGGASDGPAGAPPGPDRMAATLGAVRKTVREATSGPSVQSMLGNLQSQLPNE
jgi:hypothetical protein